MSVALTTPRFPASVCQLANGLTVIHQHIPTASAVTVDVWVKAGAILEPDHWSGMAHFLEHMIFKGTDRLSPGQFDQIIENRGGVTNAATSHDYAHYFINTTSEHFEETLPCLTELLFNAAIPDDEFVRERDVVLEEIRQAEDDPDWLGFQALMEITYLRHPYGRSVLGNPEGLLERSPDEMRCFHRAHYQPDNMTVVVVGNIEYSRTMETIDRASQSLNHRPECPVHQVEAEPTLTEIRRHELALPRLEQSRLLMSWIGPGVEQIRAAYGLDLLSVLLAGGRTSRLVRELREERQLVQGISSSFSLQRDSSLFTVAAWLDPQHVDAVEAIIGDRLSELITGSIPEAELARHKRLLCNDYAFSTETPSQLAGLYGYYQTIACANLSVTYPQHIRGFQPEELQHLVSQYLSPCRYAAIVLKPLDE